MSQRWKSLQGGLRKKFNYLKPGSGSGGSSNPYAGLYGNMDVVWWGNSIIYGQDLTTAQHWITLLSNELSMNSKIYGYPGQPWSYSGTGTDTSIYSKRTSLPNTGKMYVLYSGGNDNRLNIPLGLATDTTPTNNFSGALNSAISYIQTIAPTATIVIATSLPRNGPPTGVVTSTTDNTNGDNLMDFNARAREIAEIRGCYIWDLFGIWKKSEIISKTTDGVHPNPEGAVDIKNHGLGFFSCIDIPVITPPPTGSEIIVTSYNKTGTFASSTLKGYNDIATEYSQVVGDSYTVETTPTKTSNYDVYAWYPAGTTSNCDSVEYKISNPNGIWTKIVNQRTNGGGWYKLATISYNAGGAGITVKVTSKNGGSNQFLRTSSIRFVETANNAEAPGASTAGQDTTTVKVLLNQSGFDLNRPKHATVTNVANGTAFKVKRASDNVEGFNSTITNNIADFTGFNPTTTGDYYVEVGAVKSDNFTVGKFTTERSSVLPALRFMDHSRADAGVKVGSNSIAWRDSHQFSFELSSLVMQYMANPSIYDRMPMAISSAASCEFPALRSQAEPDIVWLMKFGAMKYNDLVVKGNKLHALTKAELAYFLYIYPEISQYVTNTLYTTIRDMVFAQWTVTTATAGLTWYDDEVAGTLDHNLLTTQSVVGTIKGQRPPGYAIVPNLLMYEVAKRDGLANPDQYMTAAINNANWVLGLNLNTPANTKGQRMSEHITIPSLAYFYEMYPTQAPSTIPAKIEAWADLMFLRSNNLWEFRKYADPNDGTGALDQWTAGGSTGANAGVNEPGNIAGFQGIAMAARRVISDATKKSKLLVLAVSHNDHVFGRNPFGRHFTYSAPAEFYGVERGWEVEYDGVGAGDLKAAVGSLEGAPKESAYPYAPTAAPGYTEGWPAFNSAWNKSIAYNSADHVEIAVYDSTFTSTITTAAAGTTIGIELKAPLNINPSVQETGEVIITLSNGTKARVTVTEKTPDDLYFRGTYVVPSSLSHLDISYGYGIFKKSVRITSDGGAAPVDNIAPTPPTLSAGTPTETSVQLTFTGASDAVGIVSYRIEGGPSVINTGNANTTYTVTGLTGGQTYNFTVKAIDAATNVSNPSNSVSVTTVAATPTDYSRDNFSDGVRTTLIGTTDQVGKTWTGTGPFAISSASGAAYITGATANARALVDIGVQNYVIEIAVGTISGQNAAGARLHFRNQDNDNNFFIQYDLTNGWRLYRRTAAEVAANAGASTLLATSGIANGSMAVKIAGTDAPETWDKIIVKVQNDSITVHKNSVANAPIIGPITATELNTVTTVGFGTASQNQPRWDLWRAYPIPS